MLPCGYAASAGALALGTVAVAPANAAVGCPTGWTEPVSGICQVVVTSTATITIPSGAGTVEAVLVGAGGGGAGISASNAAGGASGDVLYVPTVVPNSNGTVFAAAGAAGLPLTGAGTAVGGAGSIIIGASTYSNLAVDGGTVSVSGRNFGGDNASFAGYGAGAPSTVGGAGASSASAGNAGGSGFTTFSSIPSINTALWPNNPAANSSVFDISYGIGRGGFGYAVNGFPATAYGAGGIGWLNTTGAPTAGVGGVVILRTAAFEQGGSSTASPTATATETAAALASTGSDASNWGVLAAVAALAGAAALGLRRKARRTDA